MWLQATAPDVKKLGDNRRGFSLGAQCLCFWCPRSAQRLRITGEALAGVGYHFLKLGYIRKKQDDWQVTWTTRCAPPGLLNLNRQTWIALSRCLNMVEDLRSHFLRSQQGLIFHPRSQWSVKTAADQKPASWSTAQVWWTAFCCLWQPCKGIQISAGS